MIQKEQIKNDSFKETFESSSLSSVEVELNYNKPLI